MKYCQNCGKQLSDSAKFCPHCGTPVPSAAAPREPAAATVQDQPAATAPSNQPAAAPAADHAEPSRPANAKKRWGIGSFWRLDVLFCLVMLLDWTVQFLKIRSSTNIRRLVTGLLCGYGMTDLGSLLLGIFFHLIVSLV